MMMTRLLVCCVVVWDHDDRRRRRRVQEHDVSRTRSMASDACMQPTIARSDSCCTNTARSSGGTTGSRPRCTKRSRHRIARRSSRTSRSGCMASSCTCIGSFSLLERRTLPRCSRRDGALDRMLLSIATHNPIQSNPIQSNPIQSNPIQSNPMQSRSHQARCVSVDSDDWSLG